MRRIHLLNRTALKYLQVYSTSSRVIGRGLCPKCGKTGSLVLKKLGGRIYVYFKHGSKWCYIGPADSVNLSELLGSIELDSYHNITTKFTEYFGKVVGDLRMKVGTQFMVSVGFWNCSLFVGLLRSL